GQGAHKVEQVGVAAGELPVHPGDGVVLAVGVVVAVLGTADLVAVGEHGHALAEHERGQHVAHLAAAQRGDGRVGGGAFRAVVPRAVVVGAVPVVLPVGFVVFAVVGDEVGQGEAVVAGDEVDGSHGAAPVGLVEVGGAGDAGGELRQYGVAPPEVADSVAVFPVPLGPQGREVTDLVAAGAHVPRFGNELDLGDDRVLLDNVEECAEPVHVVELPGEGGGEVKAETVDVHVEHPVAQRVHD